MTKSLKIDEKLEKYISDHSYDLHPVQKEIQSHNDTLGNTKTMQISVSQAYFFQLFIKTNNIKNILEIGTGSGYQTSILSLLSRRVYSIERLRPLMVNAITCFKKLKLTNIVCECGDGFLGWPKLAPFDHLIITCAVEKIDNRLLTQVRFNGTCVVPVGSNGKGQRLKKITIKNNRDEDIWEDLGEVSFVPLISDNY